MMRQILLLLVLLLGGCAFFDNKDDDPARNWTVDRLYEEAKAALNSRYYSRAVEYYEFLETRFPFGVYGQQSLLDLAYVYYKTEDYDASIAAADRFVRLYPQNPHVDYAYYLRGLVNFNRGKGITERFLPIDLSQRDTDSAGQAFQDFSDLIRRYPESRYIEDAQKRMVYLRNLLAAHEVHVADYYVRRGAYVAAANRASYVVENYSRTPAVADALALMARVYKILEMDGLSADALRVLEMNYPDHPGLSEVRETVIR